MTTPCIAMVRVGLILCLLCGHGWAAPRRPGPNPLASVSAAARKTIAAQVGNGTIEDITRTNENGEVVYEIDLRQGRVERSLTVADDGTLLSRQVFLGEVPASARAKIQKQIGGGKLVDIFWTDETGEISYEVEVERSGKSHSFSVAPDGKLVSLQVGLAETPAPVQKTIRAHIGTGTLGDIYWALEEDEVVYVVDVTRSGKEHSFSVGADGEFLSSSVSLAETPGAVQRTIKQQVGNGRLGEIDKEEDGGEVSYEVKMFRDGQRRSFTVAANGKLLSLQVLLSETPAEVQKAIQENARTGVILRIDRTTEGSQTAYEIEAKKDGKKFSFTVGADGAKR